MNRSNKKQFALSVVTNIANKITVIVVGLLVLPLMIGYLGPEQFGWITLAISFLAILPILDIGCGTAVGRFIAQVPIDDPLRITRCRQYGLTGYLFSFLIVAVACSILLPFLPWLSAFYHLPVELRDDFEWLVIWSILAASTRSVSAIPRGVLSGANLIPKVNGVEITATLTRIGTLVFLYTLFEPALFWFGVSAFMASIVRLVGLGWSARYYVFQGPIFRRVYLKKEVVKEYLAFAKVKYFGGTGEIFRSQGPSWVVGKFLGPSNLALLSPVMTLMQMISSCAMTVILPLYPLVGKLSSGKKKADFSHWIPLFTKYLLLIELVVATPLSLYSGEILQLWLGDDFVTVSFLFGVVAVVGSMISLRWVYYFMALGGAKITAIEMSTVTSAIISLVGLAIGEGFLGWGLSESVFFFLGILLLQEVVYVPWAYRNVFKYSIVKLWWSSYLWPVGVAMLTILLGHELREFFQPASWAFLLPLLFLQAAIATGVFLLFCTTKAEREEVLKLVNSLKKKK